MFNTKLVVYAIIAGTIGIQISPTAFCEIQSTSKAQRTVSSLQNEEAVYDRKIAEVEHQIATFHVREQDFQTLQDIIAWKPNDCYAHFLLGRCFERNGLLDSASEQFEIASKLETKPEDILKRLRHHIEAGELASAYNMQSLVWEKAPEDPNLVLLHGMFMQENGGLDSAEGIYRTLLQRKDCPLGAATALSTVLMERKNWKAAIEFVQKDIDKNPNYMPACMAKGQALLALGDAKTAIASCKKALEDHPFNRRINLLMYRAYRADRNYEDALRCALRNLAGSDWISYFEDAKTRVKELLQILPAKKSSQIVEEISSKVDKTNYAMKFHFYLEQVYCSLRRTNEAVHQNEIAMNMAPEFQPNWYERAKIKASLLGDYKGAAQDFREAYKMQHSDYKSFVAMLRLKSRVSNDHRDIALQIKDSMRKK